MMLTMHQFIQFLPLLVVGCMVLQALTVSGDAVCDQRVEGAKVTFEKYVHVYANGKKFAKKASGKPRSAKKIQANDRLTVNAKYASLLMEEHLPFKYDDSKISKQAQLETLPQDGYITCYSKKWQIPLFTAQKLNGLLLKKLKKKGAPDRSENTYFRSDPRLSLDDTSTCNGYKGSGYDRGHNAPSANMPSDMEQMNSFLLSNMAPQHPKHNQVAWRLWEAYVRQKAIEKSDDGIDIYEITGTTPSTKSLPDGTVIPHKWYKLLVWCENGQVQAEYIFTLHVDSDKPPTEWASTETGLKQHNGVTADKETVPKIVQRIEAETGVRFQLTNSQCKGNTMISQALAGLTKVKGKVLASSISPFSCEKLKKKLHHLKKMGKVSLSKSYSCLGKKGHPNGRNLLDLGKGYFSAGCRTTSELFKYSGNSTDDQLIGTSSLNTWNTHRHHAAAQKHQLLTATVRRGKSLRVLDLIGVRGNRHLSAINVKLEKIISNCASKYVDMYSVSLPKFVFIPGVFAVRNTVFSLRIKYQDDMNIIAGVSGQFALGNILVDVLARYETKNLKLLLRGAPRVQITVNLKNELDSLTGTYVPIPLPSVSLTNIAVTGQIDLMKGGRATVVVSGSIGRKRVHAVFQKPLKSGKFTGAFAADIGPIKLSDLIRKTTEVDISRVPFFGSLTIPRLGVTVSSEYITSSLLPKVFCKDGLLQNTAVSIPKGLQAFTVLKISGSKIPLKLYYYKTFLSLEVIRNGRLPIGTLLSTIPGVNIRSLSLPPGIKDIVHFQIDYFSLDTSSKELVVDTQFPGTLRYFKGYLTITKPALKVIAVLKHPRKVDFEVDGAIQIGNGDYSITISRDPSSKKYVLKASFKTIPISDLIDKFSAKVLPRAFQKRLGKFIQFSILKAKLAFPLQTRNLQLHLSGTPVIGGYKTIHMSAVIIRQGEKTNFILGFQFGKVRFTTLLNKITHKNLGKIALLNQDLDTSLLISPVSLPGVHLYGRKLKDISIEKGVSIHATLQWPPNCARDKFCAVAQRVLGRKYKLFLQATIQSTSSFTLSAGISANIRLGAGIVLQRAALQIKAGRENAVGIWGSIHLSRVGITLSAGLRVGSRGVVLEGNMQGCWKRAFGAKWLTICNLHLLIAIQPTVTIVGAVEIGGQFRIGNPSCVRHPLIALGYMGVDQLSPNNNFYYVQLKNRVTMGTLLQAFCIRFHLPRPLAESGFPRGFLSSFSPIGKELPKAGISIPAGRRIKGVIRILGLEAHADVTISLPKGVNYKIALSPLRIGGGRIQMYASRSDRSRGPFLNVIVESHPRHRVDINARGFVSVLGIETEAMLRVTNSEYQYMIRGKFLRLFQASLRITAHYGNIVHQKFRVRGHFKNDFFSYIRGKVHRGLQHSSQAATRAIDNAKRKVNSKKAAFDRAVGSLHRAQHRVNRARGAFNHAMGKLRSWENKVRRLCRISHCGSVCIGCPGRWRCIKHVSIWGRRRCIFGRPSWNSCCRRITNPVCLTRNAACRGIRAAAFAGLRGARHLVGRSRGILNAANGILNGAKHVVRVSKHSLDVVKGILEGVKRANQAGIRALSAVARFGLGGAFDIRELSFNVALSSAANGHFKASVVLNLFRHLRRFSLYINLRNLLSFAREIGRRVIPGLSRFIS